MAERGFPPSFEVRGPQDDALRNVAFVYDVSLAVLAFVSRGMPEDLSDAQVLADSLCLARKRDRYYSDGRLRNAYRAGDLIDPASGTAMVPGWWDADRGAWDEDRGFNSTSTGNIAWSMLALLAYSKVDGRPEYLTAAAELGDWVSRNFKSESGFRGYTGGFEGWEGMQDKVPWKSTEHNIDLYGAFTLLSELQPVEAAKWRQEAEHARAFVLTMWDPVDAHFWTGTKVIAGVESRNEDVIPVDVQAWALLTLPDWPTYTAALQWAEQYDRGLRDGFDAFGFSSN